MKAGAPPLEELDPTFLASATATNAAAALPSAGAFPRAAWEERGRLTAALERLELYYGDMDAHAQAFRAAPGLKEVEAATHHRSALQALEKRLPPAEQHARGSHACCGRRRLRLGVKGIATVGALYQGDDEAEPSSCSFEVPGDSGEGHEELDFRFNHLYPRHAVSPSHGRRRQTLSLAVPVPSRAVPPPTAYRAAALARGSGLGPDSQLAPKRQRDEQSRPWELLQCSLLASPPDGREGRNRPRSRRGSAPPRRGQGLTEAMINLAKLT